MATKKKATPVTQAAFAAQAFTVEVPKTRTKKAVPATQSASDRIRLTDTLKEPKSKSRAALSIDTGDQPLTKKDLEVLVKQFQEAKFTPQVLELNRAQIESIASVLKPVLIGSASVGRVDGPSSQEDEKSYDFHSNNTGRTFSSQDKDEPKVMRSPIEQELHDLRTALILALGDAERLVGRLEPILPNTDSALTGDSEASKTNLWDSSPVNIIGDIRNSRREVYHLHAKIVYLLSSVAV